MIFKLIIVTVLIAGAVGEYGVLKVKSATAGAQDDGHFYCLAYNGDYKEIDTTLNESALPFPETLSLVQLLSFVQQLMKDLRLVQMNHHRLVNLTSLYGCEDGDYNGTDVNNKVVAVARGNCTFTEKALLAQKHQAIALLAISASLDPPGGNKSAGDYRNVNIVVGVITRKDFQSMMKLGPPLDIWMYVPEVAKLDPNMVLIYAIALTSIIIGAYWSGITRYTATERQSHQRRGSVNGSSSTDKKEEEQSPILNLNTCTILIMFIVICAMIVLLYFFYDYLVYVVIGLFCLAGTVGLYNCLQPFWIKLVRSDCRVPENRIPICSEQPEFRNIALGLLCIGFSVFWAVERHASYAWILQDILGFAFCINMMNTILLPNFMVCTILLSLLLIYDIFFVFITPLFTKDGSSVMVDVATGGSSHSGEQLPMVFKVPRFMAKPDSVCIDNPYSLLGFGDIIVPGLLISFNHGFDLIVKSRRVYFISSTIAYAVGLIFTYVALALMEKGQPALLYLVPCTVLTTAMIGCKRGEFRFLWTGKKCPKKNDDIRPNGQCVPSPERADSESSLSSDGERRGLINA